jgi:hypothetical protein
MCPALIGKALRTRHALRRSEALCSANNKIFADFSYSPRFPYYRSTVRIAARIVLAQHERNESMDEARTPVHRDLPIFIELAY